MNFKFFSGLMLTGVVALSSCTIKSGDEPQAGKGRLVGISSMSVPMMSITYNNDGKVTQIADAFSGHKLTINYSSKTIELLEYDEYSEWDEITGDSKEVWYIENKTTWKNCEFDSNGYLLSANATEIVYDTDSNIMAQYDYMAKWIYNPNGNLSQFIIIDQQYGNEITDYEWNDGLLTKVFIDEHQYTIFSYDEDAPDNFNRQWVPWWGNGDPSFMCMSGLFGVAPVKLITSSYYKEGSETEKISYYYSLTDSGYIAAMRTTGEIDLTFNFNYVKTKGESDVEMTNRAPKKTNFKMFRKNRK